MPGIFRKRSTKYGNRRTSRRRFLGGFAPSAIISIGSLATDTTGRIITGTLSGGTGTGYSITNGLGLAPHTSGNIAIAPSSVSVVGTTLTINLQATFRVGDTVQLDTIAGINIVDSSGNTASLANGRSVTNNSTQVPTLQATVESTTSMSVAGMDHVLAGTSGTGGQYINVASYAQWNFTYTGTDLDMQCFPSTGTTAFTITIDGGSAVTPTLIAGRWHRLPIIQGLSNTAHTVVIKGLSGGSLVSLNNTFGGYGTGTFALPAGWGKSYSLRKVQSFLGVDPPWRRSTSIPCIITTGNGSCDSSFGFRGTGGSSNHIYYPSIVAGSGLGAWMNMQLRPDGSFWLYNDHSGGNWVLNVDGVESSTPSGTLSTDAAIGWSQVFTGLDATAIDETWTAPTRRSAWFNGSSSTANPVGPDSRVGWTHIAGLALGMSVNSFGTSGANTPATCGLNTAALAPDFICYQWGSNDAIFAVSLVTFKANFKALLIDTRTKFPLTRIVPFKVNPTASVTTENDYSDKMAEAIAEIGDSNTILIDLGYGFDPTSGVHTFDGQHPNALGYTILANNLIPYLASAAFTVSGSNGSYTLTLAGGATFNGSTSVTLTASEGTISSTPAGSGNGTGTVVVTPTAGATSLSYVHTPTTTGSKTITYSNSPLWPNPAATTYTATAKSAIGVRRVKQFSKKRNHNRYGNRLIKRRRLVTGKYVPAASISLSGIVIDANGVFTGTLIGGTGAGYTPASGITNFSFTVNGVARQFSSSTVSGTTWTAVPFTPVKGSTTITVVGIAGNLRDSYGNTLIVQNYSTTNNSTKTSADEQLALSNLPSGKLDIWRSAAALASSQLVEIVGFGDSTTADSGGDYSWLFEVRQLAIAAGYTDGGRGMVDVGDTATRSGPTDNLACVQSQTGFNAAPDTFNFFLGNMYQSTTVGDTITFQGRGTRIRLNYTKFSSRCDFTYSVDGGTAVTIHSNDPALDTGIVDVSGLLDTLHTLTVVNAGQPIATPAIEIIAGFNATPGLTVGTNYYYVVTQTTAAGETLPSAATLYNPPNSSFDGASPWSLQISSTTGMKVYRGLSSSGPFGYVGSTSSGGGGRWIYNDDGSVSPNMAINPPIVNSAGLSTSIKTVSVLPEFVRSAGLVWHKNAISGLTFEGFGFTASAYNNYPYQVSLGLTHTQTVGSLAAASRPPWRAPALSINALGINNQQGAQTDTTPVTDGLTIWRTACIASGCDMVRVIPHYGRSASPTTAKAFRDAEKSWCTTNNVPWFDFDVTLDLAGFIGGGPHLAQPGYNLEASAVWDFLKPITLGIPVQRQVQRLPKKRNHNRYGNRLIQRAKRSLGGVAFIDVTPPTVVSATVNGSTLTIAYSESVLPGSGISGYTLSGGVTVLSGSATTLTLSRVVPSWEVLTLSYSGGNVTDSSSNALADFSNLSVTNITAPTTLIISRVRTKQIPRKRRFIKYGNQRKIRNKIILKHTPQTITDLAFTSRTTTSLTWTWTSPDDSIIKIDGGSDIILSAGVHTYTLTGLSTGETHTLDVKPVGGSYTGSPVSGTTSSASSGSNYMKNTPYHRYHGVMNG